MFKFHADRRTAREDNKERKTYSLKLLAKRNTSVATLEKLQDAAGGAGSPPTDLAVKLRNIAIL